MSMPLNGTKWVRNELQEDNDSGIYTVISVNFRDNRAKVERIPNFDPDSTLNEIPFYFFDNTTSPHGLIPFDGSNNE